jgi:hypothetical protein
MVAVAFGHSTRLLIQSRCKFLDNTDGGADDKGGSVYIDCLFARNKRNVRVWENAEGNPAIFVNCLLHHAKYFGNERGVPANVHLQGTAYFYSSTIYDLAQDFTGFLVYLQHEPDAERPPRIVANRCIFGNAQNRSFSVCSENGLSSSFCVSAGAAEVNDSLLWDGEIQAAQNPTFPSADIRFEGGSGDFDAKDPFGYVDHFAAPSILNVSLSKLGIEIAWRSEPGFNYEIRFASNANFSDDNGVFSVVATDITTLAELSSQAVPAGFLRISRRRI